MPDPCPQCGHDAMTHWPEHGRPETACVLCLDQHVVTTSSVGDGICCYPAETIRKP